MTTQSQEDEFHQKLAFAAHELNTPLVLIKFYAEAAKEADSQKEIERFTNSIMTLSHELIESSRLLLTAMDAHNQGCCDAEELNLPTTLNQRFELFMPLATEKNITLSHNVPANTTISINSVGLNIMLNNLLSNALKFTPEGGQVNVSLSDDASTLQVTDTAPLIPEDQREVIFEAFNKAPDSKESHSGFGLGLHVCQHIVEKWEQKLWVEPATTGGNRFCFTLPNA